MIADSFTVEPIDWSDARDRDACLAVREEVFVIEQNVPSADERDELDPICLHALARDHAGIPIATGRLVPPRASEPARIGRMAVLRDWRGRGVGEALLHLLVDRARAIGYRTLEMHAQSHAVPFYERFGFAVYGEEFVECDIAHINMRRELEPFAAPDRSAIARQAAAVRSVESREQAIAAALAVIGSAQRALAIYTRDLDLALLGTADAFDALKTLAIRGRGARIRILVQQPQLAALDGHRLIPLAQRLTSVFELRTPVEDDRNYAGAFLVSDTYSYYLRTLGSRFDGETSSRGPGRATQLREYFDGVWERAALCDELRQLDI